MFSWLFKKRGAAAAPSTTSAPPTSQQRAAASPASARSPDEAGRLARDAEKESAKAAQAAARQAEDWPGRLQRALGDDTALLLLAHTAPGLDTKLAAVEALSGEEALRQAERAFRTRERKVHKLARTRLDTAVSRRTARAAADVLVQRGQALLQDTLLPVNHLVALDRDWQALPANLLEPAQHTAFAAVREALEAALRARADAEHRLQRWTAQARQALAGEPASVAAALALPGDAGRSALAAMAATLQDLRTGRPVQASTDALDAALSGALQAVSDAQARLDAAQAATPQATSDEPRPRAASDRLAAHAGEDGLAHRPAVTDSVNDHADAPGAEPTSTSTSTSTSTAPAPTSHASDATAPGAAAGAATRSTAGRGADAAQPERPAPAPERQASAQQCQQLQALLDEADAALADGQLAALQRRLQAADALLAAHKRLQWPAGLRNRQQALRAEQLRLKSWQTWGGSRAREDLVAEAEALARLVQPLFAAAPVPAPESPGALAALAAGAPPGAGGAAAAAGRSETEAVNQDDPEWASTDPAAPLAVQPDAPAASSGPAAMADTAETAAPAAPAAPAAATGSPESPGSAGSGAETAPPEPAEPAEPAVTAQPAALANTTLAEPVRARAHTGASEPARPDRMPQAGAGADPSHAAAQRTGRSPRRTATPPGQPKLNLRTHASAIQHLRMRWKSLDKHGDGAHGALWQRFDAALTVAHGPVAAQHAAQQAVRQQNLAARLALLDALDAVVLPGGEDHAIDDGDAPVHDRADRAADAEADGATTTGMGAQAPDRRPPSGLAAWREPARQLDAFQHAWRQLGPLEHTVPADARSALQQRLEASTGRLDLPLRRVRAQAVAGREALIERAEALLRADGRVQHAGELQRQLRDLQAEWQDHARALPLPRGVEGGLWNRFRTATDAVFAQRTAAAAAREAELAAEVAEREGLIARLTALDAQAGVADMERTVAEVRRAWLAAPAQLPRPAGQALQARFDAACAAVAARTAAAEQARWQAQIDAWMAPLIADAAQADAAQAGVAAAAAPAADADAKAEAAADAAAAAAASLQRTPGAPPATSTPIDDLLLQVEIALDLPAAPPWQAARRQLKLRALKEAMEGRTPAAGGPTPPARWLHRLLEAPALDPQQRLRLLAALRALRAAPPGTLGLAIPGAAGARGAAAASGASVATGASGG